MSGESKEVIDIIVSPEAVGKMHVFFSTLAFR
jgi:hypothetical protein